MECIVKSAKSKQTVSLADINGSSRCFMPLVALKQSKEKKNTDSLSKE